MVQVGDRFTSWLQESVTVNQVEQGGNGALVHYTLNGLLSGVEPLEDFTSCNVLGKQRFVKVG